MHKNEITDCVIVVVAIIVMNIKPFRNLTIMLLPDIPVEVHLLEFSILSNPSPKIDPITLRF